MPPAWWPAAAFAGRGDPPRSSTSTIVAGAASGSHCLKIDGFSRTKGLPAGERLQSIPFTVGGHRWRLNLQPNGNAAEGHASLYLLLDEDVAKPVTAQFEFSIGAENRPSFFLLHVKRMKLKHAPFTPRVSTCNFASRAAWGFSKFLKWADLENQRYLEYDCFVIKCDVVVINEFRTVGGTTSAAATPAAPSFVSVPPSDLCQQLGVLLDTEKGADVVFRVGGETFAAHRALLRFIYTDSLPEMKKGEEDIMFQNLLVAADRYNIERLKLICEEKLCEYVGVGTVAAMLVLADQLGCDGLNKACFNFLKLQQT
uniref:MATH domain-containing protein n=1 Tax=Oryza rufipogon TaxID=4529 RepID=A0A0E0P561_ORYRU